MNFIYSGTTFAAPSLYFQQCAESKPYCPLPRHNIFTGFVLLLKTVLKILPAGRMCCAEDTSIRVSMFAFLTRFFL
jgi:hypothetical protein